MPLPPLQLNSPEPEPRMVVQRVGRFTWKAEASLGLVEMHAYVWSRKAAIRKARRLMAQLERDAAYRATREEVA